jgi:hypothetical protein
MVRAEKEKQDPLLVLLRAQPRPAVPLFGCGREAAIMVLGLGGA